MVKLREGGGKGIGNAYAVDRGLAKRILISMDSLRRFVPTVERSPRKVPDHTLFLALLLLASSKKREDESGSSNSYGTFSTPNELGAGGTFL